MGYAVEMKGITMQFPKVRANDHVDFCVEEGEIHALVGENGAGKSTLMNILYGLYEPTGGEIRIHGSKVEFHSAIDAIQKGIGMVHQHFMLIPRLSVIDNIALGEEPAKGLSYDRKTAVLKAEKLLEEYDMKLDLQAKVQDISLGMQQRVEIMKALYRNAGIIIFDEPTAVLTPQEIEELGSMLKRLKSLGKTMIIITHKLQEVIDFSDRITVLRRGKVTGNICTRETTPGEITRMMVGRDVVLGGGREKQPGAETLLRVEGIWYQVKKRDYLKQISFTVQKGEILGIAGIDNSGQTELTEILAGIRKSSGGKVWLEEQEITGRSVRQIRQMGVGFISQDRQRHGLALHLSIWENLVLGYQDRKEYIKNRWFTNAAGVMKEAGVRIKEYDIRPDSPDIMTCNLSGGNQQKVMIAREVSHSDKLIIANQPTRGVDIGAIELIHHMLIQARSRGEAVILVSLELDEILQLSDRIGVMHDGVWMGVVDRSEATREKIGLMMAGQRMEVAG